MTVCFFSSTSLSTFLSCRLTVSNHPARLVEACVECEDLGSSNVKVVNESGWLIGVVSVVNESALPDVDADTEEQDSEDHDSEDHDSEDNDADDNNDDDDVIDTVIGHLKKAHDS